MDILFFSGVQTPRGPGQRFMQKHIHFVGTRPERALGTNRICHILCSQMVTWFFEDLIDSSKTSLALTNTCTWWYLGHCFNGCTDHGRSTVYFKCCILESKTGSSCWVWICLSCRMDDMWLVASCLRLLMPNFDGRMLLAVALRWSSSQVYNKFVEHLWICETALHEYSNSKFSKNFWRSSERLQQFKHSKQQSEDWWQMSGR